MANFKYSARGSDGKVHSGTMTAGAENEAIENLQRQGLTILSINEAGAGGGAKDKKTERPPFGRVGTDELVLFTRQLATMINSGIPLLEALEIMCEQVTNKKFQWVLRQCIDSVRTGSDLSAAMSQHPKVFTKVYVNMIRAGEAAGQIDEILIRLAEYQEANAALKRDIRSAMTYPVVSLCMVFGITIFLMVGIVPKFKEIYDSIQGLKLPAITSFMLAVSLDLRANLLYYAAVAVALVIAFVGFIRTNYGQRKWHWAKLWIPVFGPLFQKVALSRFTRTFATLLRAGVPMLGTLEIVAKTSGNRIIEDAVLDARESVQRGESLATPLAKVRVFPPVVTRMISVGEKSGALESLLEKISEFYEQQVKASIESLTSLIEPLMIGLMGVMVGGIVLSIFLPLIKLQEALSQ